MSDAEVTNLGVSLRVLREREKMSLREFAEKAGVNHADIFRIETGATKNPSVFLISKIAKAFGLSVDELMNSKHAPCPTCNGSGWVAVP